MCNQQRGIWIIKVLLNNRAKCFGHEFSRINTDYQKIKEESVQSVFSRVPFLIQQHVSYLYLRSSSKFIVQLDRPIFSMPMRKTLCPAIHQLFVKDLGIT